MAIQNEIDRLAKMEKDLFARSAKMRAHLQTKVRRARNEIEYIARNLDKIANGNLTQGEAMHVSNDLDSLAELSAFLGSFIEYGNREQAERRRKAVRKALGYTRP